MGTWCIDGWPCPHGRVDPKGIKWAMTHQFGHCAYPNYHWECDTDVPITLFVYVGPDPAWKKRGTHEKRGIVMQHAPDLHCRWFEIVCQNEHENTLHHTFDWEVPTHDITFYWHAGGEDHTIFGRWSASKSPCFNALCPSPAIPPSQDCQPLSNTWTGFCQWWNALAQIITPTLTYTMTSIDLPLAQFTDGRHGPYAVRVTQANGNCWAEPVLSQAIFDSGSLPYHPNIAMTNHPMPNITLHAGIPYHLIATCITPWTPGDWAQAIWWRCYNINAYPQGSMIIGCNLGGAGLWAPGVTQDHAFCIYGWPL